MLPTYRTTQHYNPKHYNHCTTDNHKYLKSLDNKLFIACTLKHIFVFLNLLTNSNTNKNTEYYSKPSQHFPFVNVHMFCEGCILLESFTTDVTHI